MLEELGKYREVDLVAFRNNVGQRWVIERGVIEEALRQKVRVERVSVETKVVNQIGE